MTSGLSEELDEIKDFRKSKAIDLELHRLNVDIAALQETRLLEDGSIRERNYTFFWKGKEADHKREHGVGFAVKNSLLGFIEQPTGGTERLLKLRLCTAKGVATFICAYAPTLKGTSEEKDQFYDELNNILEETPNSDVIYILGDFNARVGKDQNSWPICLGKHNIGNMNENGQRLLEFCTFNNLCITNSYFKTKPQHKVTWMHPRSKHWHQLDFILTRHSNLNNILQTRAYQSADCDTDHSLVIAAVKMRLKKIHTKRHKCAPRIDVTGTKDPDKVFAFDKELEDAFSNIQAPESADQLWNELRNTIHEKAINVFGKKSRTHKDWVEDNIVHLMPLIQAKKEALIKYKDKPTRTALHKLKEARSAAQKASRHYANKFWSDLANDIQQCSDTGNIKGMYQGIKKATGQTVKKSAPLKSKTGETITDKAKQMDRWVEHYLDLYSIENTVSETALLSIKELPVLEELDQLPTMEEIQRAINNLSSGKAPGQDGIPAEIYKCGQEAILPVLHLLLLMCWNEGAVPQDMRDASIVTLYKNKGDRSDCNNYRGISLLSIAGKIFAKIILKRLQTLAERIYPESQCGFRGNRSTIDMIFSLRQMQEKCREKQQPLYMAFIDLTKAFDLVSREGLFQLLARIGCPPKLLSIIKSFHTGMKGTVNFDGSSSEPFEIKSGVKQGCVLAPTLFGIFFSLLLDFAFGRSHEGVLIHSRSDGKLFNISRFRATTKIRKVMIRELLFADDAAFLAHSEEDLQHLVSTFSTACQHFGLTISIKKTKILPQNTPPPTISLQNERLENVDEFTYLGSTVTHNLSLERELSIRIGKAATAMNRLKKRVWQNSKLTIKTKMKVYSACVLSTLLYGSETWTTYTKQEQRLNSFHLRCLRRIMNIRWQDKITNTEVLTRAGIPSIPALLTTRRLRWLGHVRRMDDGRIPKDILYGEVARGKRPRGRPYLRFRDACLRDMRTTNIPEDDWEDIAKSREDWKRSVTAGVKHLERTRAQRDQERRERRHKPRQEVNGPGFPCPRCTKVCESNAGLGRHLKACRR